MTKTKPRISAKDRVIKELTHDLNKALLGSQHFGSSQQGYYREDAFRPATSEDYLQLFESYGHLFACVDAIARNAASIPFKIYQLKSISGTKDRLGEEVTDGSWWSLLNTPNKFTSGSSLVYGLIAFQQLTGTAYLEKVGQMDMLVELWPLRPDWMKIKPDAKDLIGGYEYDVDGTIIKYTAEEVFRFKSWHPRSELYGLAPIGPAQNAIITDLYCSKYSKQFFKQGGHLNWYLKIKEEMSEKAFKRLEQQLKTKFAGLENAHSPAVIDNEGEIKELGSSPDRNVLLPQKTLSRKEIYEVYGVPPIIGGFLDEATYNNAKEQERIFWEQKEMPLIRELVDGLNRDIFWPNDMEVKPDFSGVSVLQTNYNEKAPAGKTLVDGKIMTPNEVRKNLFGLEPLEGGDEFPQPAPSPFGGFGGGEQKSELPTMLKVLDILMAKGGQGSGNWGHSGRPGEQGGSASGVSQAPNGQITLKQPKNMDEAVSMLTSMSNLLAQAQEDVKNNIPMASLRLDHVIRQHARAQHMAQTVMDDFKAGRINKGRNREAIRKAVVDHRTAQVARAYTDIEKVCVAGYSAMGQAVLGVIGKVSKLFAVIKKDVVAEALASLDAPTMAMAKELLKVERSKLKPIIEAEFKRAKRSEPDEKTLDELDRKVGTHLERMVDESMKHITKTNKDRVENKLTALLESDATTETIRKEFEDLFSDKDTIWSRTVARTEALKFTETARFSSLSEMGFDKKEWFHSGHEDAREDHLAADGEVVPMGKKFSTGLLYPGDPNGDAGDVVNCGCTFAESVAAAGEGSEE